MKIKIRLLKKKDILHCVKIILETKAGRNKAEIKKLLALSLTKSISFLNPDYYVLEFNGKVVGISGLYYDYEDPRDILWMDYFAVLPKFQRQGFGTALLKNLEKISKKKKIRILCVFSGSKEAINFYLKKGFKIAGTINNYYGKGLARFWLSKKIG